jgi:hypothetical protein
MKWHLLLIMLVFSAKTIAQTFAGSAAPVALSPLQPQKNAGGLATGVVSLEVDKLGPFAGGAAIVYKGSSTAMIDASGRFIVPFNKYQSIEYATVSNESFNIMSPKNVFFLAKNAAGNSFFLDSKGKLIHSNPRSRYFQSKAMPDDRYLLIDVQSNPAARTPADMAIKSGLFTILDIHGKVYTLTAERNANLSIAEGLILSAGSDQKLGYRDLTGKFVIKPEYDFGADFSEGLAVVGKKNEYGELQYGFIDKSGKLIIPLKYSNKPESFYFGLSKVRPRNPSGPDRYSYINTKDEVVITVTREMNSKFGNFYPTQNGWFISDRGFLMDLAGNIKDKAIFLRELGIPKFRLDLTLRSAASVETLGKFFPKSELMVINESSNANMIGWFNLKTGSLVEPVFSQLTNQVEKISNMLIGPFDPVSRLMYAKKPLQRDKFNKITYREGYVNEAGEFVIVVGEGSKW